MSGEGVAETTVFKPQRQKAALVLLSVTLIWGATFIWMKQALNALEVEIETFGTFSVVAFLVALRFLIAMVLVMAVFPKARAGLRSAPVWKGGPFSGADVGRLRQSNGGPQRHQSLNFSVLDLALRGDDGPAHDANDTASTASSLVLGCSHGHPRCWFHRRATAPFVGMGRGDHGRLRSFLCAHIILRRN